MLVFYPDSAGWSIMRKYRTLLRVFDLCCLAQKTFADICTPVCLLAGVSTKSCVGMFRVKDAAGAFATCILANQFVERGFLILTFQLGEARRSAFGTGKWDYRTIFCE